jgi:hypothetical protein
MDLHVDAPIPFPRDVVFQAFRDDITKVLPYLPNVRSIELKSRKDDGPRSEIVMVWRGGGDIPAAFRAFLSEAMLSWTDYATWDSQALRCDWRSETHALSEAVTSRGANTFVDDGHGKTILQLRGTFEIDPKKIRGLPVPGFLVNKVGKGVEEFLGGKIAPNLLETAKGITRYLQERG